MEAAKNIHDNSVKSYAEQSQSGSTEGFRKSVFRLISESKEPMTDRRLMSALKESDCNNVRPEVTRLKDDGLIVEAGKVKCTTTGKTVRCTKATGLDYFPRKSRKNEP